MQIIDILRHHAGGFARAVKARQGAMTASGLRGREVFFHGEAPAPGFVPHLPAREKIVERDGPVLGPQSARGTEIRDPAFG